MYGLFGLLCAAPLVIIVRALDRAPLLGVTTLALAGLVGNIALQLHCPIVSRSHLLAGHFTVPLFLILVAGGIAVIRRSSTAD